MNYNTVYVGMDVHKKSFTLCCMTLDMENAKHVTKVDADYKNILIYLDTMRDKFYGDDTHFICGYEAGCLGYTLYHQLTAANVECVILAPSTMTVEQKKKTNQNRQTRCCQYRQMSCISSIQSGTHTYGQRTTD